MIDATAIELQLKKIGFNYRGWGRSEVHELRHILLPDEEIFECVNGIYEGGFAMLLATDIRVLLVDKKPLNYLTVEDMRFDMINEIDYNHRLIGAYIKISAGNKNFKFSAINQPRLRKLIGHVQLCMADAKKRQSSHQEGQNQHLEQINQQLQSYLLTQYQQQQKLHDQLQAVKSNQDAAKLLKEVPEPPRPSPELSDYLYAQRLLEQHESQTGQTEVVQTALPPAETAVQAGSAPVDQMADLYAEGMQEVFGKHDQGQNVSGLEEGAAPTPHPHIPFEINPLRIAYSKLPTALRHRKFGRPSFRYSPPPVQEPVPPEV